MVQPLDARLAIAHLPTPLEPADRLGRAIGLAPGQLWIKRDDCTGLATGGNKARKLDYLAAAALGVGADMLITAGGPQSNHARSTAAVAARLGLRALLLLSADEPKAGADAVAGNLALDHLFGAEIRWLGPVRFGEMESAIDDEAERQRRMGHTPFPIPVGGASPLGALGYVRAARELLEQAPDVDVVVTADGTGGTHAGLVAGLGDASRVLGVDVGARPDLDEWLPGAAAAAATLAGLAAPIGAMRVDHRHVGGGYAEATDDAGRAARLAAREEGLVLDPVYTSKAMAGLCQAVGEGTIGGRVVFLHTGGVPAVFAPRYVSWLAG